MTAAAFSLLDRLIAGRDAETAAAAAAQAAEAKERSDRHDDMIRARIANLAEPTDADSIAIVELLQSAARFKDASPGRRAIIEAEGLAPIVIKSDGSIFVHGDGIEFAHTAYCYNELATAVLEARRAYLDNERKAAEAARRIFAAEAERLAMRAEIEAKRAADDAEDEQRIAEWRPAYAAYLDELGAAYRTNRALMRDIADRLAAETFTARRFTYAIVYGDGADPTTETIWITGDSTSAQTWEINSTGQIEPGAMFYHPVKIEEIDSYTTAGVFAAENEPASRRWERSTQPPIRKIEYNDGICSHHVIAAPAGHSLYIELEARIAAAGGLDPAPEMPQPPIVHSARRLEQAAAEIEDYHLSDEEIAAIHGRHLASRSAAIPF